MEGFSQIRPKQNPLQSAPTTELCFIHEFAANCYEFLRNVPLIYPKLKNEPDRTIPVLSGGLLIRCLKQAAWQN
jgi:hypothetical protein